MKKNQPHSKANSARNLGILSAVLALLLVQVMPQVPPAFGKQMRESISPASAPTMSVEAQYGQLPLSFEPNVGQSNAQVRYQARGLGGMMFFEDDAVALSLPTTDPAQQIEKDSFSIVYLRLDGTEEGHRVTNGELLPGTANYFIGNDPSRWRTDLPTYAGIIYEQLYPGVDLYYDGALGTLKGTYTLAPNADPSRIRWHYEGIRGVLVDPETGDLQLALKDGATLTEKAPSAWQTIEGERVSVKVQYAIAKDDTIGFLLGEYETAKPLTIDPQIIFSSYIGGSAFDSAKAVAVDVAGDAYITGITASANYPVDGTLDGTFGGYKDAFVTKFIPSGGVMYSTYLGGSDSEDAFGDERAGGIAVDAAGNVYVTGATNSTDFPVVNAIQGTHGATTNADVFVAKINNWGNTLVYSTFLGGSSSDAGNAIAVDDQGSAYVVGDAGKDFPGDPFTTSGHAFVTKINYDGTAIEFSKFLGGSYSEYATDVAVDGAHNVYVVGNTFSTDFPVLNAAQPVKGGSNASQADAFVTKIKWDGSGLVYSTYLGGSKTDQSSGIALDNQGNAYVTGWTQSNLDFPIANAFQPAYGGDRGDAFVTKLNATGNSFVYSTYLGGNSDENYSTGHGPYGGIVVDSAYNAFVTGSTCSDNFPTLDSVRNGKIGTCYAFVTGFNAAGNKLLFSTLIGNQSGGSNSTAATDIALDAWGNVYVVGETNAPDFDLVNPWQSTYRGLYDAFITKLRPRYFNYLPIIER